MKDLTSLNAFQKQLDRTRVATIIHDIAKDDDMSWTYKQLEKEINELKIMLDWYHTIGFLSKGNNEN